MAKNGSVTAARALFEDARADPGSIDIERCVALLEAREPTARRFTLDALRILGEYEPGRIREAMEASGPFIRPRLADEDPSVRAAALAALTPIYEANPSNISSDIDRIREMLEEDPPLVVGKALRLLERVARYNPDPIRGLADTVIPFLSVETPSTRASAVVVISAISEVDADEISPAVPALIDIVTDPNRRINAGPFSPTTVDRDSQERIRAAGREETERARAVRAAAARTLAQVAVAQPGTVVSHLEQILEILRDPDPQLRLVAAEIIVPLAKDRPQTVLNALDTLQQCLREDDLEAVHASLTQALSALAAEYPQAIVPVVEEHAGIFHEMLVYDAYSVRGSAAHLLAISESPAIVRPVRDDLEELAETSTRSFISSAARDALGVIDD